MKSSLRLVSSLLAYDRVYCTYVTYIHACPCLILGEDSGVGFLVLVFVFVTPFQRRVQSSSVQSVLELDTCYYILSTFSRL